MRLEENVGSDRSWVWTCQADFADEEPKQEVFAIRFANSESNYHPLYLDAQEFKTHFESAKKEMEGIVGSAPSTPTKPEGDKKEDEEKKEDA